MAQVKNLFIGTKGQMDWSRPGARRLVSEEPSGACSYAFAKKTSESPAHNTVN